MISILGGEVLSALGNNALEKLKIGSYNTSIKKMMVNDEELIYPYYSLDDSKREHDLNIPLLYLEDVVQKAITKLGLGKDELSRCGVFLGNSSYEFSLTVRLRKNFDGSEEDKIGCERLGSGYYAQHIVDTFGLSDIALTCNTACTSSANAMIDATSMLEAKIIDYALVIGMEIFLPASFEGFAAMQLLSSNKLSSFDKHRDGLVLGEAFSALFLSRQEIASSSWTFIGGSSQCDTHSVTGADVNGEGIARIMNQTLSLLGYKAEDIKAIKAHGTASQMNDLAEVNGMKKVFKTIPNFFSFKPYIGHTLGSCGTSELILLLDCVNAGFIPSTPNFEVEDEELSAQPLRKSKECKEGIFMLNYFGFGGNNTSILIQKTLS